MVTPDKVRVAKLAVVLTGPHHIVEHGKVKLRVFIGSGISKVAVVDEAMAVGLPRMQDTPLAVNKRKRQMRAQGYYEV